MQLTFTINKGYFSVYKDWINRHLSWNLLVVDIAALCGVLALIWAYHADVILAYSDAESHINIAKRVIHSVTPGIAQLGGIWLPLPHLLMIPFVWSDFLWRTGFAGSIISLSCFVLSALYIFKSSMLIIRNRAAGFFAAIIFILNPNILYIQTTPMTELPLIMFFIISTYYFLRFVRNERNLFSLIAAAFFGFCATLTRYDGWFLVLFQALTIPLLFITKKHSWKRMEGKLILYATLAFFGIMLWLLWDYMILGDPLYFTTSEYSAKSQQQIWFDIGALPAYKNLWLAIVYYGISMMSNSGIILFVTGMVGFLGYLISDSNVYKKKWYIALLSLVPILFNIVTLLIGQSVIFLPHLSILGHPSRLFNVRYGLMALPFIAIFSAFLYHTLNTYGKNILKLLFVLQLLLFIVGYSQVVTLQDGLNGSSKAERNEAEIWLKNHYDGGLVLHDQYVRSISLITSGIPMQNSIYIGTKPYWEESLSQPEKYARWIVMRKDDILWSEIYQNQDHQARLLQHFDEVYRESDIFIFKQFEQEKL